MRSMITAYSTGAFMRVPPRRTGSALTPACRAATSCMNCGGQDHSRPTSRPTFSVMPGAPLLTVVALRQALQPAEGGLDHLAPADLVVGRGVEGIDVVVEHR